MAEAPKPETERRKFRAIKGVRDILPPDSALWNWFEKTARGVMEAYNFAEIRTPIFEETELFARSVGADTDIVGKEMFSFEDHEHQYLDRWRVALIHGPESLAKGRVAYECDLQEVGDFVKSLSGEMASGDIPGTPENISATKEIPRHLNTLGQLLDQIFVTTSPVPGANYSLTRRRVGGLLAKIRFGDVLALRPEATASVVRAYIEHRLDTKPGDQRLYYIGPMFRRERPQKGRYRQFYQIGAEILGTSDAPAIDAELIQMLMDLVERCQIEKYTLLINSIGCTNTKEACRPKYVELLRAELRKTEIFSKLGADSKRRVDTNPLRVMDSKLPEEQAIIEKLPKLSEHLCEECRTHYEKLKKELDLRTILYQPTPRLVRGLDYYMRTTFEITSPILGAQNALCGGGRYDGLVEMLGGPQGIKGIGFALGEDRFIDAIEEAKKVHATRPLDIFIAWMGARAYPAAVRLAHVLRGEKHRVELPAEEMKFRKALERADKLGARHVLIIGDDEIASDMLTIKRLADGKQEKISEEALVDFFRPRVLTKEGPGS